MTKKTTIMRYSIAELEQMRKRSQSDWAASDAMTEEEIEAAIASDPDEAGMVVDWTQATLTFPAPKAVLNMRVDQDVLDYFRGTGRGYQTKINAILRAYVDAQK